MNIIKKAAKVWYLELKKPKPANSKDIDLIINKVFPVDLEEYLHVYRKIGGPWDWANRLVMDKEELRLFLNDEQNEIYYALYNNEIVGYIELDMHHSDIELVYFGLSKHYIGKGFGREMINYILLLMQKQNINRVWLHTCEFDSPQALAFYLKSGFTIYDEKIEDQTIIEKNL